MDVKHIIIFLLFLAALGCVGGGSWGLVAFEESTEDYVPATARIKSRETTRRHYRGKTRYDHKATVEFDVAGLTYHGVLDSPFLVLNMDDEIAVVYNPEDPYEFRAVHYERFSYGMFIALGLFAGWAGWVLLPGRRLKSENQ